MQPSSHPLHCIWSATLEVLSISILLSINHVSMFFSSICTFSLCLYKPATCSRRCSAESKSKDNMPLSCATRSTHGINDISNLLYKAFRLNISLHAFSKSKAFSSSFFFSLLWPYNHIDSQRVDSSSLCKKYQVLFSNLIVRPSLRLRLPLINSLRCVGWTPMVRAKSFLLNTSFQQLLAQDFSRMDSPCWN